MRAATRPVPDLLTVEMPVQDDRSPQTAAEPRERRLALRDVERGAPSAGIEPVTLHTSRGAIVTRLHPVAHVAPPQRAVVWVAGAGGGLDGPAHGLYPAGCEALQGRGIAGLRVDYRRPNDLPECILDTLLAVAWLRTEGTERIALVGHSFGGAVAISAGALSTVVTAVVPLSTQTYGADLVSQVSPRPLLVVHGTDDEILPAACSELVYAAAREPKELKLFRGARHGLDSVRDPLLHLLVTWLEKNV